MGLHGETRTLTGDDLWAMPHVSVTVTNGHSHQQESYRVLLSTIRLQSSTHPNSANAGPVAMNAPAKLKSSPRLTVILAWPKGTDHFRIAIALCDTGPTYRSGQAVVADTLSGQRSQRTAHSNSSCRKIKRPGRSVRNLNTLTEKNLGAM